MAITGTASLTRLGELNSRQMDAVAREIAADVHENITVGGACSPGTPIKDGFARASWIPSVGTPDTSGATKMEGDTPPPMPDAGIVVAGMEAGDTYFSTNNAAYIRRLEHGHSKKAPNGMVDVTIVNAQAITDDAVRRVRESRI